MKPCFHRHSFRLLDTLLQECGQDLVEYALLVALMAFGATAGMKSIATKVNTIFNNIGTTLTSNT